MVSRSLVIVWMVSFVVPALSIPLPDEFIANDTTQQCMILTGGDECTTCYPRSGWEKLGFGVDCPSTYTVIASGIEGFFCVASRSNECCSQVFSGTGDCRYLITSPSADALCSISLCNPLPDGWMEGAPGGGTLCPYFDPEPAPGVGFVGPDELDCDNPCEGLTTCTACLEQDCMWSSENDTCQPACNQERCFAIPVSGGITPVELCGEVEPTTTTTSSTSTTALSTSSSSTLSTTTTPSDDIPLKPPCNPSFCEACYYYCGEPPYVCTSAESHACKVDVICEGCELVCQQDAQDECVVGCQVNSSDYKC